MNRSATEKPERTFWLTQYFKHGGTSHDENFQTLQKTLRYRVRFLLPWAPYFSFPLPRRSQPLSFLSAYVQRRDARACALFRAWLCFRIVLHLEAFQCPRSEISLLLFGACPLTCGLCFQPTKLYHEFPAPPRCQSRASGRNKVVGRGC